MIVKGNFFPKLFSWFMKVNAITLWPWIFIRDDLDDEETTINHEKIHLAQATELWVVPFYLLYGIFAIFKKYKKIPFEAEAFDHEEDFDYIEKTRKDFAWRKYI